MLKSATFLPIPLLILRFFLIILILESSKAQTQELKDSTGVLLLRKKSLQDSLLSGRKEDSIRQTQRSLKNETSSRTFAGDTLIKSPWGAVAMSFVIPGLGQIYNGEPSWAATFVAADLGMASIYYQKNKKVRRIENARTTINRQIQSDPFLTEEKKSRLQAQFNRQTSRLDGALNDRNLYGWLFAISHLLGMVNAYVDAHLYQFDEKMNLAGGITEDRLLLELAIRW